MLDVTINEDEAKSIPFSSQANWHHFDSDMICEATKLRVTQINESFLLDIHRENCN